MTHRFAELMFTPNVKAVQEKMGSRKSYARFAEPNARPNSRLGESEREFIAERDSFYIATVSETGWPYVQHRGGPAGFMVVLDDQRLGFADYRGNKQYVSVGNLATDDRVSLFLMDYPNRQRLKLLGHARIVEAADDPDLFAKLTGTTDAVIERAIVIDLEAFDWNCPQFITPRYSQREIEIMLAPVRDRLKLLESENAALKAAAGRGP